MLDILLQATSFLLIILVGFLLKKINLLDKKAGNVLSIIILNVTLPAAIIISLVEVSVNKLFFILVLVGFIMNFLLILVGNFLTRSESLINRKFFMFTISGYNIGNFSLPFVQGFSPAALPFLCMFDIGNSFMLAGGSNILIDRLTGDKKNQPRFMTILRNLLTSIPFLTYFILFFLKVFSLSLPDSFIQLITPIGNANAFLSMFMIGLYLELRLPRLSLFLVVKLLFWRYAFGISLALIFYFLVPFPPIIKVILALLSVAPVPTYGVINSVKAGMTEDTVGFTSSLSILISLALMTGVMILFL